MRSACVFWATGPNVDCTIGLYRATRNHHHHYHHHHHHHHYHQYYLPPPPPQATVTVVAAAAAAAVDDDAVGWRWLSIFPRSLRGRSTQTVHVCWIVLTSLLATLTPSDSHLAPCFSFRFSFYRHSEKPPSFSFFFF